MRINIGITSAGSAPAVSVIKALKSQKEIDFKIISFDMDKFSSGFFLSDKSCVIPKSNKHNFISHILGICKNEQIKVLIPIIDEELLIFADNKDRFENSKIKLIANDSDVIKLAKDKFSTYQFCLQNNISVPKTFLIKDINRKNFMSFPWIIKPLKGRGSIDTFMVERWDEFEALRNKLSVLYIVQEFISGKEYTIDIVSTPKGRILQAIPRERIVTKAGMSYKGRTVANERLSVLAKQVAEKFKINGPANIQFKIHNNKMYLIEVNPKFSAGLPLTVAAGVNIPLLLIKMALGYRIDQKELRYRSNLYMLRYWNEVFIDQKGIRG